MSNKIYDAMKYITMYIIPAIGLFYNGIAMIWNLPFGAEVNQTLILLEGFLAAILGISAISYNKEGEL